jgi:hypothetical protein
MTSSTKQESEHPADFVEAWGRDNVSEGMMSSPEVLRETARALQAVQEFLVEPIAKALKTLIEDVPAQADSPPYWIPEGKRHVTYADIGRLIVWTDELRQDIGYLLDPIVEIALLAHEDLGQLVQGYVPDGATLTDKGWNARLRRFHGLNGSTFDIEEVVAVESA